LGFLDDDAQKQSQGYRNLPVLGGLSSWKVLPSESLFLTSLYGPKSNLQFFRIIKSLGIPESRWITLIDPYAIVSPTATIGHGTYIGPWTVLEPMVRLGNYCAMLGNVYIAHDSHLGDYVVCANSVSISGRVSIGEASFIGANATVRENTHIGSYTIIGMGSVVISDIADGHIVAGNPARAVNKHLD
jgi:sugar O-acyltransferase (sialic acid O-acetyltransferase NeuD family)